MYWTTESFLILNLECNYERVCDVTAGDFRLLDLRKLEAKLRVDFLYKKNQKT